MSVVKFKGYNVVIEKEINSYDQYLDKINDSNELWVVTDENIYKLYKETLESKTMRKVHWLVFPPGDESKNSGNLRKIFHTLLEQNFKRTDILASFGGGMVTDLAGLAAALFSRGSQLVHIPTSIISQIDASVGGKTGINIGGYKNMAGVFYDPRLVLIETDYLKTLSNREFVCGLGELIKVGLIGDEFILRKLEKYDDIIISERTVKQAIEVKQKYVEMDYFDEKERRVLNFGHTFGHAIEAASNFKVTHGQAIVAGMVKAIKIGINLGITNPQLLDRLMALLDKIEYKMPDYHYSDYRKHIIKDKKSFKEGVILVLLEDVGKPAVIEMTWEELDELANQQVEN